MTQPFAGEVQIFSFPFAPYNWAFAAGQLVPVRQSTALYSLYGTAFGGDGSTTFGLPNLASRMACGSGQSPGNSPRSLGQAFGVAGVGLTGDQNPPHNHGFADYQPEAIGQQVSVPVVTAGIGTATNNAFGVAAAATMMNGSAISISGVGAPHENRQPVLGLNYCVALLGNYPSFG